jgi:hypothetical protein
MHQKLTKHGKFCKQNNQLPTKSHVELKDTSNVLGNFGGEGAILRVHIVPCTHKAHRIGYNGHIVQGIIHNVLYAV